MQLTIDNLDGNGAVEYSQMIDASQPCEILRTLNEPSILKALLCLAATTLPVPARRGRVVCTADSGTVLFTGYLTTEPAPVYAGEATEGAVYRFALSAVSDEWLLDKQSFGAAGLGLVQDGQSYALRLAQQAAGVSLPATTGTAGLRQNGVFTPAQGESWSSQVGQVAAHTYSAYRVVGGSLALTGAGGVQHTFSDGDGSLTVAALKTSSVRELANDVTITGAEEPNAYFTEIFLGDGTTADFSLTGEPSAPSAGHAALLTDLFAEPAVDRQLWQWVDSGNYLSLTAAGLTMNGGNGLDGATTLTAWNPVELGGTLVFELSGVTLAAGSAGVLGGLYSGLTQQASCFAGFNIRQAAGTGDVQTIAVPMVDGVEVGTPLTVVPGHRYTLRLHLHSPELLRLSQTYYAQDGSGDIARFGGGVADSAAFLVFEARDEASSSNTPVTILYDGSAAIAPAQANFVAVNCVALTGSIAAIHVTCTGSCWIRSTSAAGTQWTRLAGKAADGLDCSVTSSADGTNPGRATFFAGRVPAAGEMVQVFYRGRRRAVARIADPASLAAEAAGGASGTARWVGHVVSPPARSQQDCEFAAQAILSFAASRSAALSGSYIAVNPVADRWPGDSIMLNSSSASASGILRRVTVSTQGASPEVLTYRCAFANDWAEGLSLKLTETVAGDALLPALALDLTTATPPELPVHVLANLQEIAIAAPSAGALGVDAGLNPPAGGGFEVRRRDGGFGVSASGSASGDLVLRSPVRGFSIPLSATQEIFYLRMYDASTPPLYSRNSAAIVTHLPAS